MSAKLDVFNAIKTALETIKVSNDRVIQTVGLWNNQLDTEKKEFPFNFPVCFIEFVPIRWNISHQRPSRVGSQGDIQKQQNGEQSTITIHIGFAEFGDAKDILETLDPVIDAVYFAIQGKDGDLFTPLLRSEERQDTDHDRVIDWQMDFTTSFSQLGEQDAGLLKIAANTLALQITKDLDINTGTEEGVRTGDGDPTT